MSGDWRLFELPARPEWLPLLPAIRYRRLDDRRLALRFDVPASAANAADSPAGAWLALIGELVGGVDLWDRGIDGVCVNLNIQYPAAGQVGTPVDGIVEVMGETGRMHFTRVSLVQGEACILQVMTTTRKLRT